MSKIIKVIYIIFLFVVVFSIKNIFDKKMFQKQKRNRQTTLLHLTILLKMWNTNKTDIEPDTLLIDFVFFDPINNGNFMSASLGAFGHNHRILDITPLSLEQNFRNIHYNHFLQNRSNFKIIIHLHPFRDFILQLEYPNFNILVERMHKVSKISILGLISKL